MSEAIRTGNGFAFITLAARKRARVPKFDEVKERVRVDVITDKAAAAARAKAAEVAAAVKAGTPLAAAAKAAGKEVRTTELIARNSVIADIGVSPPSTPWRSRCRSARRATPSRPRTAPRWSRSSRRPAVNDTELDRRPRLAATRAGVVAPQPVLHRLHEQGEDVADDQPLPGRDRPGVTACSWAGRSGLGPAAALTS